MTGIQALERIAPGLPMLPGKAEQREFEYRRHGAQILIAALNVTAGKVEAVVRNSPIGKVFRALSAQVVERRPTARWDIVGDNLFICESELSVWRPRVCGLKENLCVKGRTGVLASKAS
jgi:hypothetical protein